MGQPAELSKGDRATALRVAHEIVDCVATDAGEPIETLARCSRLFDVPAETLLLWLAQVIVEKKR